MFLLPSSLSLSVLLLSRRSCVSCTGFVPRVKRLSYTKSQMSAYMSAADVVKGVAVTESAGLYTLEALRKWSCADKKQLPGKITSTIHVHQKSD